MPMLCRRLGFNPLALLAMVVLMLGPFVAWQTASPHCQDEECEMNMICLRFYVGAPENPSGVSLPSRLQAELQSVCGYDSTVLYGMGMWKGKPEDCAVVELLLSMAEDRKNTLLIRSLTDAVRREYGEEVILITRSTVDCELIERPRTERSN